jgi:DNA-binding PadR family transcriptional regulator
MASRFPTSTELHLLRVLRDDPKAYGLQIVEASGGKITRGSIYVLLDRLTENGYVNAWLPRGEQLHAGMPRPRYTVSSAGKRVLELAQSLGIVC